MFLFIHSIFSSQLQREPIANQIINGLQRDHGMDLRPEFIAQLHRVLRNPDETIARIEQRMAQNMEPAAAEAPVLAPGAPR